MRAITEFAYVVLRNFAGEMVLLLVFKILLPVTHSLEIK
jgi:hypothetical protein